MPKPRKAKKVRATLAMMSRSGGYPDGASSAGLRVTRVARAATAMSRTKRPASILWRSTVGPTPLELRERREGVRDGCGDAGHEHERGEDVRAAGPRVVDDHGDGRQHGGDHDAEREPAPPLVLVFRSYAAAAAQARA
jgi:hypothetical protein